jgi:starvation-inducible DNA-binding protein
MGDDAGNALKEASMAKLKSAKETHVRERLGTPTDLKPEATRDISAALAGLLADVFALYMKTKNFHWHMSGPHFRDYHLLLDEQGEQIFDMTDDVAERARKIGGATLRSIGDIARRQTAHSRQRRRLCRSEGHAGGAARRQ